MQFEEHLKLKLLLKDAKHIKSKASVAIENSYVEFGLHNIYSKIKLLSEFEKQTNIKRFDYSEVKVGCIEDKTWAMIQKLFRKKNPKPECEAKTIMAYTALINNIVKLYEGKVEGDRKKNKRVYTLDTERLRVSFSLDYITMSASNPLKNYDKAVIKITGLKFPDFDVDEFNNVIFD